MTDKEKKKKVIFDLMFHGCQSINAPMAEEILDAILAGKIAGVSINPRQVTKIDKGVYSD